MSSTLPFYLVAAFTTSVFAGNPAAIAFLDPNAPLETLRGISANFSQPMTAFVSPNSLPPDDPKVIVRRIRFLVTNGKEVPICGHATLAAANVIFNHADVVDTEVDTVEFRAHLGAILRARRVGDGSIEIQIPTSIPRDLSTHDKERLSPIFCKAFGRQLQILEMKDGGEIYPHFLLVEIDAKEDLKNCVVDLDALRDTKYGANVVTTASTSAETAFVSRMFSPLLVGGEDPVCGAAHGILTPFWHEKQNLVAGSEVKALQVSPRGGQLRLLWEREFGIVRIKGHCAVIGSGNLFV